MIADCFCFAHIASVHWKKQTSTLPINNSINSSISFSPQDAFIHFARVSGRQKLNSHDYHLTMPTTTVLMPSLSTANYWRKDNELLGALFCALSRCQKCTSHQLLNLPELAHQPAPHLNTTTTSTTAITITTLRITA